jgi:hypothetical protein
MAMLLVLLTAKADLVHHVSLSKLLDTQLQILLQQRGPDTA